MAKNVQSPANINPDDWSVEAWKIQPGQYPVEGEPPSAVPPQKVTILVPYGSLFYAAAPVFNAQLPEVTEASRHAVVILALRGKKDLGSTFLQVVTRYAKGLQRRKSKLMLVGICPSVLEQMERTGILRAIGRHNVFMASEGVGQALLQAVDCVTASGPKAGCGRRMIWRGFYKKMAVNKAAEEISFFTRRV